LIHSELEHVHKQTSMELLARMDGKMSVKASYLVILLPPWEETIHELILVVECLHEEQEYIAIRIVSKQIMHRRRETDVTS
jgi:hypothetical protein